MVVYREAGAVVQPKVLLRDRNVLVPANDGRQLDFVVSGLRGMGVPACVAVTVASPLHADGSAWEGAARTNGHCLQRDRERKHDKYYKLASPNPWES